MNENFNKFLEKLHEEIKEEEIQRETLEELFNNRGEEEDEQQ